LPVEAQLALDHQSVRLTPSVVAQDNLLFDLGTPVHASAAAVCWVFGSGAGLLLLAWNVKYSPPGINVVYNLTLSKLFIWTYANRLLPHTAGKFRIYVDQVT